MSAMWKKMLAPILITVLLVAWFAVWLIGCAYPLVLEGNRNPRVRCMDRRIGICVGSTNQRNKER